jgi:hypothetical protein
MSKFPPGLPANFQNASPFPKREKAKDKVATVVFATAILAFLAFALSLLGLLQIQAP